MTKPGGLGRGLGALISDNTYTVKPVSVEEAVMSGSVAEIEISKIVVNNFQPRQDFDQEALNILAESIRQYGVIQPITLRKLPDGKFQIISGERRFRASQLAGLEKVPGFIRDTDDDKMLELALVENIHREDLNDIEVALSYRRLIDECGFTQEDLSAKIGKGRATVTNILRLLKLPDEIQNALRQRLITQGQVRPLITIDDPELQIKLFRKVSEFDLSSRQVEELIKNPNAYSLDSDNDSDKKQLIKVERPKLSDEQKSVKKSFTKKFNVPVDLKFDSRGEGKLIFKLKSREDYDKIVDILNKVQL